VSAIEKFPTLSQSKLGANSWR